MAWGAEGGWFQSEEPRWRQNLFKRVLDDQRFLVTKWWPSEARQPSFGAPLLIASLAAATSGRHHDEGLDARLEDSIHSEDGQSATWAHRLSDLGDAPAAAVLLGGSYLISRWTRKDRFAEASSLAGEALIDTSLYTSALKVLTRRSRPSHDSDGEFFRPRGEQDTDSFPSGHAAGSFAVATVFAARFHGKRWVPWLAYGTAGLIGTSRVVVGRHFPSDVLFGAVLGHSMGQMVVTRASGEDPRWDARLEPIYDPGSGAYGLAYHREW